MFGSGKTFQSLLKFVSKHAQLLLPILPKSIGRLLTLIKNVSLVQKTKGIAYLFLLPVTVIRLL